MIDPAWHACQSLKPRQVLQRLPPQVFTLSCSLLFLVLLDLCLKKVADSRVLSSSTDCHVYIQPSYQPDPVRLQ